MRSSVLSSAMISCPFLGWDGFIQLFANDAKLSGRKLVQCVTDRHCPCKLCEYRTENLWDSVFLRLNRNQFLCERRIIIRT